MLKLLGLLLTGGSDQPVTGLGIALSKAGPQTPRPAVGWLTRSAHGKLKSDRLIMH
jgi:hypothetical protein